MIHFKTNEAGIRTFAVLVEEIISTGLLRLAIQAIAAHFRSGHGNFDAAIAFDLLLQLFVEAAFELAHFAAAQAGNVNVIARSVALVEMAVASQVQQIELVDQPLLFEQINGAIDRDAMNFGIDLLGLLQNFIRVQMARGRFHHLQQGAPLAGSRIPLAVNCFCKRPGGV